MKHKEMSERTVRKLIEAGIDLFSKQGYMSTSIDQIVKNAQLSKGAFYAHFESKEEFLIRILRESFREYFEGLQHILDRKNQNLMDSYMESSKLTLKESYQKGFSQLLLQSAMVSRQLPNVHEKLKALIDEWRQNLIPYFDEMKKEGLINKTLDSERIFTAGVALFMGYNIQHYIDEQVPLVDMMEVFLEVLQSDRLTKE